MLKHCRCITTVQWNERRNIYILFIQVKEWTKSTNDALPQGSVELNARQNEKVKKLKRREK